MPGRSVDILINAKDGATPAFNSAGSSAKKLILDFSSLKNLAMAGLGGVGVRSIVEFGKSCVMAFAESGKEGETLKKGIDSLSTSFQDLKISIGQAISQPFTPWLKQINEELRKGLGLSGREATAAEAKRGKEEIFAGPARIDHAIAELRARRAQIVAEGVAAAGRGQEREAFMPFAQLVPGGELGNRLGIEMEKRRVAQNLEQIAGIDEKIKQLGNDRVNQLWLNGKAKDGQGAILDPMLKGLLDGVKGFANLRKEGIFAFDALEKKIDDMAIKGAELTALAKGMDGLHSVMQRLHDDDPMVQIGAQVELKSKALALRNLINPGRQFAMEMSELQGMANNKFLNPAEVAAVQRHMEEGRARSVFGSAFATPGGRFQNDSFSSRGLTRSPFTDAKPELKTLDSILKELQIQKRWQQEMLDAIKNDPAKAKQILEIRNGLG